MRRILQSGTSDGLKITVIKNRQGLDHIVQAWEKLQNAAASPVPAVDPYHYVSELESLGPNVDPYILCMHREGRLEGMLVGRRQLVRMPIRLGYLTIMKTPLREILVYYSGLLGQRSADVCSLLLKSLRQCLNNGEADVAVFDHVYCDSTMYSIIRSETPLLSLGYSPRIDGYWKMEMPKSMNEFYGKKSSKIRRMLRKKIRKLESSYQVFMKTYSDEESLEQGVSIAASVSSRTYQYSLGGGLSDNPQMLSYLMSMARRGWLRVYILYVNNEPAAFEWGIKYMGTFFLRAIGFDPKWRHWSVGTVLFLKVLEALCEEGNVNHMDFGPGDAEYKKIYGDTRIDSRSLFIYPDRFYPRLINAMRMAIDGVEMAAVFVVTKLGLERKFKRVWRDRLRRKLAAAGERTRDETQNSIDPDL